MPFCIIIPLLIRFCFVYIRKGTKIPGRSLAEMHVAMMSLSHVTKRKAADWLLNVNKAKIKQEGLCGNKRQVLYLNSNY